MTHGNEGPPRPKQNSSGMTVENAGNAGKLIVVGNQTINLDGQPAWIQALSLDELKIAEKRLHRASLRHESRSVLPLATPIVLFLTVGLALNAWASKFEQAPTNSQRIILLALGLLLALPIWLAMYDIRRRNREVVKAAERRWAEVIVEIALRADDPPPPPGIRAIRAISTWWNDYRRRRKQQ